MTTKYVLYNITYDDDGSGDDLPEWLEMENSEELAGEELLDAFSDYISDETGFCHEGYSIGLVLDPDQL